MRVCSADKSLKLKNSCFAEMGVYTDDKIKATRREGDEGKKTRLKVSFQVRVFKPVLEHANEWGQLLDPAESKTPLISL